jgi:quinol monooxygenase YgiN
MIIVAGWLRVTPEDRGHYLEMCREVIRAARSAAGCIDFHLSADALDEGRINIFEQWKSA